MSETNGRPADNGTAAQEPAPTTAEIRSQGTPTSLLSAAVAYARRGWRVVPLRPGDKRPREQRWPERASADPEVVRDHWVQHPADGIGIATGPGSGLWVLDVDGEPGRASLAALIAEHGPLPATYTVRTAHGGLHFYFTWPAEGVRQTAGALGTGLDTRAAGGYVVAPPTVLADGGAYVVEDGPQ